MQGSSNFQEEVARHICKYFEMHLQDELAIADEYRKMDVGICNIKACPHCSIPYNLNAVRSFSARGIICMQCSAVQVCGRRFCHFDFAVMIEKLECQCPPVRQTLTHWKHHTVCGDCAMYCHIPNCKQRLCGLCRKKCPLCQQTFCEGHVVKKACILCMQEEADAYRVKWPQHKQEEEKG